jgi:hypothetical protein
MQRRHHVKRHTSTHRLVVALLLGAALLVSSAPASAHHGTANVYDNSKAVVMKGVITKFEWTNPHNQIYFDVTDEKGGVTHWTAATEPPQVMLERGWTRKSLPIGEQVTVYVFVAKNGAPVGNLQKIVLANGTELSAAGGGGARGAAPAAEPAAR